MLHCTVFKHSFSGDYTFIYDIFRGNDSDLRTLVKWNKKLIRDEFKLKSNYGASRNDAINKSIYIAGNYQEHENEYG